MELEELQAGWNVLNKRLAQNEILNKRIIKEMIRSRVLNAYQRLLRKNIVGYTVYFAALLLTALAHTVFGTPLLVVYIVGVFLCFSLLCSIPTFVIFLSFNMEKPLTDSFRRILFYQRSMRFLYPFIVGLGSCAMLFIFVYFKHYENVRQIAINVLCFLIAFLGSMIEYRCDRKKLGAMKKGLEELKEFEEEEAV